MNVVCKEVEGKNGYREWVWGNLVMENICITPGTRPEIIKPPPVIRACESRGMDYHILYTGQHYSYEMDGVFFEEMELPEARYNPDVGSGRRGVRWRESRRFLCCVLPG